MTWFQDFHFLRPWWLLGLIIPAAVYVFTYKNSQIQSAWQKVCDKNLLDYLLIKNNGTKGYKASVSAALITLFLVMALAGPTWLKKENPALSVENPVMILLNMSGEMWNKDVSPSRIERAKYVIKDLTKSLKNTESGLIVYSKEPFMITPLTEDTSLIDNIMSALQLDIMPQDGDRLDRAIELAVSRMQKTGLPHGNLIVITSNVGERFDAALTGASQASDAGFDVNIVNISKTTNDKLQMVADKGNGLYLNYQQSLAPLIQKINDITAKEIKQSKNMQTVWEDMGWYLLWLPALLFLFSFRRGAFVIIWGCFFNIYTAEASWFLNDNQEALHDFEKQNYAEAAEKFTDTQWKGAAAYKNGDYEAAYENFLQKTDATALYNQGNALAKGGKIAEAIKKYEEALKKQPDFADAKFNLEYLKKQQQQKNQQNQQQKQEKNKQKQKQQNEQQNTNENTAQQNQPLQKQQNQDEKQSQKEQAANANNSKQQQNNQKQQSSSRQQEQQKQQAQSSENNSLEKQSEADNKPNKLDKRNSKAAKSEQEQTETAEQKKTAAVSNEDGQEKQQAEAVGVKDEKTAERQEKIRARLQKFRQVPEDKGGLLRAMIQKEYAQKRYKN